MVHALPASEWFENHDRAARPGPVGKAAPIGHAPAVTPTPSRAGAAVVGEQVRQIAQVDVGIEPHHVAGVGHVESRAASLANYLPDTILAVRGGIYKVACPAGPQFPGLA